jgi:hypothetical protein
MVEGGVHKGYWYENDGVVTYPKGWHGWNMVNFHEEPGTWGGKSSKWTSVDLTWDDPTGTDDPDYIQWTYFQFPWSILPSKMGALNYRELTHQTYSAYPTDTPMEDDRYTGTQPYVWEDGA